MPVSNDVVRTTYAELKGPAIDAFRVSNHLWEKLQANSKVVQESGYQIERVIMGGSPAQAVGIYDGSESLDGTRFQQAQRYQIEPHRIAAAINIPKQDMAVNDGALGVVRLIQQYPESFLEGLMRDINSYLLTGVSQGISASTAELSGFTTLNGEFTSGRRTGTTNGLLDFVATGSQTDTVQNVAKSSTIFHFNQYRAATNWATNGYRTLKTLVKECATFAPKKRGPDLGIMDLDSHGFLDDELSGRVRLKVVDGKHDPDRIDDAPLVVHGCPFYYDNDLDTTQFTAAAGADPTEGLAYVLNSEFMEMPTLVEPTMTDFADLIALQDALTAKFEMHCQLIFTKFPAHGCIVGIGV